MGWQERAFGLGLAAAVIVGGGCGSSNTGRGEKEPATSVSGVAPSTTIEHDDQGFVVKHQQCPNGKKVTIKTGHLAVGQTFKENTGQGNVKVQALSTTSALIAKHNKTVHTVVVPAVNLIPAAVATKDFLRTGISEDGPLALSLAPAQSGYEPLLTWGVEGDDITGAINYQVSGDGINLQAFKGNCS